MKNGMTNSEMLEALSDAEARIRELEAVGKDALFVLTYPTQAIFAQRSGPDSFQLRECDIKTAKEMQQCGYMYIDDDGNGPYFTDSKNYADRYLHSWAVFKVAPRDGHVCDYELAYGKCRKCLAIERALTEHKEQP